MNQMKTSKNNKQAGPICKFGPGGDFTDTWQPEPSESFEAPNFLVKILITGIEALGVVIGLKRNDSNVLSTKTLYSDGLTGYHKEDVINAFSNRKIEHAVDSTSTATVENGSSFPREPLLFPNFSRDGCRTKHKPQHNIRTYRRTAKKRPAFRASEQGSLFESQFHGVQSA